jgi:hypothetical protein
MNKSVATRTSENSNPIDIDQLSKVAGFYKDKAEYYGNRLTDYLRENNTTYPLYDNPGDGLDVIHPKSTQFMSGFYFGDSYECKED